MIILTSGELVDYQQTCHEIVRASDLPISIIFVGIGDSEFKSFKKIDNNIEPIWSEEL